MDNSETTKSDRLEELELFEYRERLIIKVNLELKRNAIVDEINRYLKDPMLKNDVIVLLEHTKVHILPTVENIEELRRLVSSLKEKRTELKDEYKRRLFSDVVVEISYEEEMNRLISVKNEKMRKIMEESYQIRVGNFKTLLDRRNELVSKINGILRYTSFDNENDIYMEKYSSSVTNFSLENSDNLRRSISRLNIKLAELEYVEKKSSVFV